MNLQEQSQPPSLPYTPTAAPTFVDPASYHQEPIMYPPMPQFSAHGPAVSSQHHHPQQHHIQQLNMRHALFQSGNKSVVYIFFPFQLIHHLSFCPTTTSSSTTTISTH